MITRALKTAIQLVLPSVSKKNALADVVKCVRFCFEDGELSLTASNLEQTSTATLSCDESISGSFLLDGEAVRALLRLVGDETSLKVEGSTLHIESGHINLTLPTSEADGFPSMIEDSNGDPRWSEEVSAELIANSLVAVAHSAGKEKHRQHLMAIRFIEKEDGTAMTVATDGHRMSLNEISSKNVFQSMLLPTTAIKAIQKSIGDSMACIIGVAKINNDSLLISGGHSFVIAGETEPEDEGDDEDDDSFVVKWQHAFRLMNEQGYPDVVKIFNMMADGDKIDVLVDIKPIRSAIGLANLFDTHKRCILNFKNNNLVLTTRSDKGKAVIQLGLLSTLPDTIDEDYVIAVSGDYFMQSLGSCSADDCLISFPVDSKSTKPLIISAGSKKDLIMPMRV